MLVKFKARFGVITLKLPLVLLEVESFVEAKQSDFEELIDILNQNISSPFALVSHRSQGVSWDPTVLENLALPKLLRAIAVVSESDQARRLHKDIDQVFFRHAGIEHVATFSDMESAQQWCLEILSASASPRSTNSDL